MMDLEFTNEPDLDTLRIALRKVAERTLAFDMPRWFWGDAIAIDGLLEAADLLDAPEFYDPVESWLSAWARRFMLDGPVSTDHLAAGLALVTLAQRRPGRGPWLQAAENLARYLDRGVARAVRTGTPHYRPDDAAYRHTIWVDTLYHEPVFLAALGRHTGEARYLDQCIDVTDHHFEALLDAETGLLPQAVDTANGHVKGLGWARGIGWAVLGLADTLALLDGSHAEAIRKRLDPLVEIVLSTQDRSGFWHTLLHDREAYLETSTATFFGAACYRLARLQRDGTLAAARRALYATLSRIDESGAVWGVSGVAWAATSPVPDAIRYKTVPTEFNLWGQGSALRLLAEAIRFQQEQAKEVPHASAA
jgi:unsaturated rhamnogalacturonyl hydrolase